MISNHKPLTGVDRLRVGDTQKSLTSLSPRSSLSSLSPPASPSGGGADLETFVQHPPYAGAPPTYQDFVNVQRQQRETISSYLSSDGLVDSLDEDKIAASLAQMSLNPQDSLSSPHMGMYSMGPGDNGIVHGAGIPVRGGLRLNVDSVESEYAAEFGNTPLSPINEGIAGE